MRKSILSRIDNARLHNQHKPIVYSMHNRHKYCKIGIVIHKHQAGIFEHSPCKTGRMFGFLAGIGNGVGYYLT